MSSLSLVCDEFQGNITSGLISMLESEQHSNVTIAVEGQFLKAHQVVLSICSPYFNTLLQNNPCQHPIIFMKNVKYKVMKDLLRFMYEGQTQLEAEDFECFIETAQELQIKWLTKPNKQPNSASGSSTGKRSYTSASETCASSEQNTGQHESAAGIPDEERIKRPKLSINKKFKGRNADAGSNSRETKVSIKDIKVEMADSYLEESVAEPIDKPRDLKRIDASCKRMPVEQKQIGNNIDIEDIEDEYANANEGDQLFQPMEPIQEPSFALQPPSASTTQPSPVAVLFHTTKQGEYHAVINKHLYFDPKEHESTQWATWRCKNKKCHANVTLTRDYFITFNNYHTHGPNGQYKPRRRSIINEVIYYFDEK